MSRKLSVFLGLVLGGVLGSGEARASDPVKPTVESCTGAAYRMVQHTTSQGVQVPVEYVTHVMDQCTSAPEFDWEWWGCWAEAETDVQKKACMELPEPRRRPSAKLCYQAVQRVEVYGKGAELTEEETLETYTLCRTSYDVQKWECVADADTEEDLERCL